MIEFLVGVGVGVVICAVIGFLIWRNNRAKWGKITDQILASMDEYKDPIALKLALVGLLSKIKG